VGNGKVRTEETYERNLGGGSVVARALKDNVRAPVVGVLEDLLDKVVLGDVDADDLPGRDELLCHPQLGVGDVANEDL
jgi:hypothetical protein